MIDVVCNLCGRDEWDVRFPNTLSSDAGLDVSAFRCTSSGYGRHAQVVQCRHCGYVYANPRWSLADLMVAYGDVEDAIYAQEREGRELTFRRHLAHLEQFAGPALGRRLLDVGAYIGVFVEVARQAGWDALGVEPSSWAVAEAQSRQLPVIAGTLDAPALQGQMFDVITMWDVIEHVDDPAAELAKAAQLLKPGGWIAVHTMDIDSLAARIMGRRWPWLMAMHLHYFSQRTLSQMLRQSGYDVVWSGSRGRYLRLGYLASRLGGLNHLVGNFAAKLVTLTQTGEVAVPVSFGDLFTVYARRTA